MENGVHSFAPGLKLGTNSPAAGFRRVDEVLGLFGSLLVSAFVLADCSISLSLLLRTRRLLKSDKGSPAGLHPSYFDTVSSVPSPFSANLCSPRWRRLHSIRPRSSSLSAF